MPSVEAGLVSRRAEAPTGGVRSLRRLDSGHHVRSQLTNGSALHARARHRFSTTTRRVAQRTMVGPRRGRVPRHAPAPRRTAASTVTRIPSPCSVISRSSSGSSPGPRPVSATASRPPSRSVGGITEAQRTASTCKGPWGGAVHGRRPGRSLGRGRGSGAAEHPCHPAERGGSAGPGPGRRRGIREAVSRTRPGLSRNVRARGRAGRRARRSDTGGPAQGFGGGTPAVRQCEPAEETTTAGVSAPPTARVLDEPGAAAASEPEPPVPRAPSTRHLGRSRRRTVVSATAVVAAVLAVLLGAIGVAGWALSRPHTPISVPAAQAPPPAAVPVRQWTATARIDVAPTGVTLRSAPSTAGAPVGRLTANAEVQIQCGEIGRMTSSDAGERSSSWLRTTAGNYLAAVNVEVRGPSPMTNCTPGRPPVPVPHHR